MFRVLAIVLLSAPFPDAPVVTMTHYPTSLTQPNAEKTSLAHLYHNTPNTAIISSQQKNIQTKKWAAYFAEGSTMRIPYDSYHMNHSHFSISFWLHLKSSGYETTDYHYIYTAADQFGGNSYGHNIQVNNVGQSGEYIRFLVFPVSGSGTTTRIDMNRSLSHYKTPLNNRWVHVTATYSGDGTSGDSNTGTLTIDGGFTRNTLSRGYGAPLTPPSTLERDFIIGADMGNKDQLEQCENTNVFTRFPLLRACSHRTRNRRHLQFERHIWRRKGSLVLSTGRRCC